MKACSSCEAQLWLAHRPGGAALFPLARLAVVPADDALRSDAPTKALYAALSTQSFGTGLLPGAQPRFSALYGRHFVIRMALSVDGCGPPAPIDLERFLQYRNYKTTEERPEHA